jgi:ABC-type transport system involved in multi-copper enzyme maturation permease subunit
VLRALAWKEWREQRPLVLAGLGVAALMPFFQAAGASAMSRSIDLASLAEVLPVVFAALLWPIVAAAAGASTVANEIGDRTLEFLLSRPVPRWKLWAVKVLLAAASTLIVVAGSLAIAWSLRLMAGEPSRLETSLTHILQGGRGGLFAVVTFAGGSLLVFAASVFCSTCLSRPLSAAAAGLATSLIVVSAILFVWARLDLQPRLEPQWVGGEMGLAAALILIGSLFLFARGEMLRGRAARRRIALASGVVLGALALASVPLIHAQVRLSPGGAVLWAPGLSPSGDAAVTTAMREDGNSPQVWLIRTDGTGMARLTGRLAFAPVFSPDGEWIAYVSQRSALGLRADELYVRLVRPDGSGDRLLTRLPPDEIWIPYRSPDLVFSPDGAMVALVTDRHVTVTTTGGRELFTTEIQVSPAQIRRQVAGWSKGGREILLLTSGWRSRSSCTLRAYDVESGQPRIVYHLEEAWAPLPLRWNATSAEGWSRVPLTVGSRAPGAGGRRLELVEIGTGAVETITSAACYGAADLSSDETLLAYAVCPDEEGKGRFEVHRKDLTTGEDLTLATLEGSLPVVSLSPAGDRILVERNAGHGSGRSALTIDLRGETTPLPEGWGSLGWSGARRAVLVDGAALWYGQHSRVAVADAGTGDLRPVYP